MLHRLLVKLGEAALEVWVVGHAIPNVHAHHERRCCRRIGFVSPWFFTVEVDALVAAMPRCVPQRQQGSCCGIGGSDVNYGECVVCEVPKGLSVAKKNIVGRAASYSSLAEDSGTVPQISADDAAALEHQRVR